MFQFKNHCMDIAKKGFSRKSQDVSVFLSHFLIYYHMICILLTSNSMVSRAIW